MLTIALYVILSTLQSQTPGGLQTQASHRYHWEFHFFFFPFGGKLLQISFPSAKCVYLNASVKSTKVLKNFSLIVVCSPFPAFFSPLSCLYGS